MLLNLMTFLIGKAIKGIHYSNSVHFKQIKYKNGLNKNMTNLIQKILNVFLHNKRFGRQFNYPFFIMMFVLCIIGAFAVYSASNFDKNILQYNFFVKQIIWYLIGIFIIIPICMIYSYKNLEDSAYFFYAISILFLLCVFFLVNIAVVLKDGSL